jgi:short-subunit dehydrogenase
LRIAIITGASSGIGKEFAIQLDKISSIDKFILISRHLEDLELVSELLSKETILLPIDLSEKNSINIINSYLINNDVSYLVNSAGFGKNGDFITLNLNDQLNMINLNCRAIVELTHLVIPFMNSTSSIINISSIAGFAPLGSFAIYGATKAFLNSFSVALKAELKHIGINILTVTPGSVDTNFQRRSRGNSGIKKKLFSKKSSAEAVVTKALVDLKKRRTFSTFSLTAITTRVLRKLISPLSGSRLAYHKIYSKK